MHEGCPCSWGPRSTFLGLGVACLAMEVKVWSRAVGLTLEPAFSPLGGLARMQIPGLQPHAPGASDGAGLG